MHVRTNTQREGEKSYSRGGDSLNGNADRKEDEGGEASGEHRWVNKRWVEEKLKLSCSDEVFVMGLREAESLSFIGTGVLLELYPSH